MSKYKCEKCGILLADGDIQVRSSYLCEYGECAEYEDISVCPVCGCDELLEVEECVVCGEWHIKATGYDDVPMHDGICEECLCKASVDECVEIAKEEGKHMVEINAFLASSFTPSEIEDILKDALKKSPKKAVTDYALGDTEWFAEQYKKVRKE